MTEEEKKAIEQLRKVIKSEKITKLEKEIEELKQANEVFKRNVVKCRDIEIETNNAWEDKIRDKIKELEEYQKQHKEGNWTDIPIEDYDFDKINLLKELLEEN